MADPQKFYVDRLLLADLRRVIRKVDGARGVGVVNTPTSLTFSPPQPPVGGSTPPPPSQLPVGQYQYQVYCMVSQNQAGWSRVLAGPM